MQFWGTKSALCPPRAVQILLAVAERAAMAPLGGEFCVQSVPPFVLLLFNAPFLITFFRKMLLAAAGSTFLHNDCKRSALANPLFWHPTGPDKSNFYHFWSLSSLRCPFMRSMTPKLDLKNLRKYVYYCYRWLPWTTWTMYPTSFWWHLHVCDIMLVTFSCIRHDFNSIFYIWASFFHYFYENVLPAKAGSTFSKADFCQHLVQSKISIPKMASKPLVWGGDSLP